MSHHPETALVPFVAGDLEPEERARVAAHLESCGRCRDEADAFRALLAGLAASAPSAPSVHPGRYRAELREKLAARAKSPSRLGWRPWRAVPVVLSTALAGVLIFVAVHGVVREPRGMDLVVVEDTVLGQGLDLLRSYPVIEKLELLEDLDVIRDLDRLAEVREGRLAGATEGSPG